ncbi:MAG: UvrD-helicase domain-containing protein [Desulfovibrionaceae bacterium]|nr:UvrD-helicase domain-containing protein [Desulfovibrionaceae bacterium]
MIGLCQIKASAGSGKTFTLTRHYLNLLAQGHSLESILAITFTNAAAAEMRSRILQAVKQYALGLCSDTQPLFSPDEAKRLVNTILYNYTALNVRTIDSLLMQMVRTASLSLQLNPDFQPVFSSADILAPYLETLSMKARLGDKGLERSILAITDSIYRESDTEYFLARKKIQTKLSQLFDAILLKECDDIGDAVKITELRDKKKDDLLTTIQDLIDCVQEKDWDQRARKAMVGVVEGNLKFKSDYFSKDSVAALFHKNTTIPERAGILFQHIKNCINEYKTLCDGVQTVPFVNFGKEMVNAFLDDENAALFLSTAMVPGLVRSIFDGILKADSKFVNIASGIQDILIDEFQDTSDAQWMALFPLVEEALAKGGSLTWVGDIKQSIFSWRGGNPDLFDGILDPKREHAIKNVQAENISKENLPYNWRSGKTIVDFNNRLYKVLENSDATLAIVNDCMATKVSSETKEKAASRINKAFANVSQKLSKRQESMPTGYVDIRTTTNEESIPAVCALVTELSQTRPLSDILILSRANDGGQAIAVELLKLGIPVVTENSLLLAQNGLIIESIGLLRYLVLGDPLAFWTVLTGKILGTHAQMQDFSVEQLTDLLITKNKPADILFRETWPSLWEQFFEPFTGHSTSMTAYDLISEWYALLDVEARFPDATVFTRRLLEILHIATLDASGSLSSFLEYWESASDNEKVPMPEHVNAVRIMTIHKAKGLEAPIVIFPWKMPEIRPQKKLIKQSVDGIKVPAILSPQYREEYDAERIQIFCEAFNLLYVATTRPCEALYIFCVQKNKDIFASLAARAGIRIPSTLGEAPAAKTIHSEQPLPPPATPHTRTAPWKPMGWIPDIKLAKTEIDTKAENAKQVGMLVHYCLQYVRYEADIQKAAERALSFVLARDKLDYLVDQAMRDRVLKGLSWFLSQKESREWLSKGMREQMVLDTDGTLLRCDLIVPGPKTWLLIDYRSGAIHRNDTKQIHTCCTLLGKQGINARGLLVYLEQERFILVDKNAISNPKPTYQECLAS